MSGHGPPRPTLAFILGAPNDREGELSPVSLRRIASALERQRGDRSLVLLATGGFGRHFNSTETPHRELVYRHLEAMGATIDRADASDLLSSNTVEDIALIVGMTKTRGIDAYCIITSRFHVARCRFIVDCLADKQSVNIIAADDPVELAAEASAHEIRALRQLSDQGGVMVGDFLYLHPRYSKA
ncbi:YdcF family protein [Sphingorhabdus sp.]|uniref:YdcF family protein n=1 Tax=Sphingorhabdus sp. TaxID=1902408 RepID=UPI003593ECB0